MTYPFVGFTSMSSYCRHCGKERKIFLAFLCYIMPISFIAGMLMPERHHIAIHLESDFTDYYDALLDGHEFSQAPTLVRNRATRLCPQAQFRLLTQHGLDTPYHGRLDDVRNYYIEQTGDESLAQLELILYDENGRPHLHYLDDTWEFDPARFSCEYIPTTAGHAGKTLRFIQAGNLTHWLSCSSTGDWRSATGDVAITHHVLPPCKPLLSDTDWALYSVEFIQTNDALFAVGIDVAPCLARLDMATIWSPETVANGLLLGLTRAHGAHRD
jgi:hypothetical protein